MSLDGNVFNRTFVDNKFLLYIGPFDNILIFLLFFLTNLANQ